MGWDDALLPCKPEAQARESVLRTQQARSKRCLAQNVKIAPVPDLLPDLLRAGLAAGDEVEHRGTEVGQPLLADALAPQEGGGR